MSCGSLNIIPLVPTATSSRRRRVTRWLAGRSLRDIISHSSLPFEQPVAEAVAGFTTGFRYVYDNVPRLLFVFKEIANLMVTLIRTPVECWNCVYSGSQRGPYLVHFIGTTMLYLLSLAKGNGTCTTSPAIFRKLLQIRRHHIVIPKWSWQNSQVDERYTYLPKHLPALPTIRSPRDGSMIMSS